MRLLLSAFVCQPGLGSEEGVGWGTALSLSQRHCVHVLTTPRHRGPIEAYLRANPCPNLSFSYFDLPKAALRLVVSSALWQLYYYAWQRRVGDWAKEVCADFQPDLVHHVTYGRYWAPSSLWKLNRPFVWGPLGGADNCPPAFLDALPLKEQAVERMRPIVQGIAHRDPHVRATARHATIALASTPATAQALSKLGCKRVISLLQMAVDDELLTLNRPTVSSTPTFCSIGKLCGWKGQFLSLRAFAAAAIPGSRLVILGAGASRQHLTSLAKDLGIAASVHFLGNLPRDQAMDWLGQSTALLHPSLHDQAPTVVLEAMAMGTPVIALKLGGPAVQLTDNTGFLIEASEPAKVVSQMAHAMRRLSVEPSLRERMGEAGRARLKEHFTWSRKAEQFNEIYHEAMELQSVEVASAR